MNYYLKNLIAHLLHNLHNGFSKSTLYHYGYDIHGNVKTLWQDNKQLEDDYQGLAHQRIKRLDYNYDLISGNVNLVSYQNDSIDAFHHKYVYDADNRITEVNTNRNSKLLNVTEVWSKDAKYFYYDHGPLARVELGHNKVQGIDYAYTLQGWLKGVNSETLDTLRDMGSDAAQTAGNNNANFAKDVFGYSLNYFNGDYASITSSNFLASKTNLTNLATDAPSLYNGNINYMVTSITNPLTHKPLPQLTAYKYDQLNRLLQMKAFDSVNFATNQWEYQNYDNKYFNSFSYDANGNLMTANAYNANGEIIDNQDYNYQTINGYKINNRLYSINDSSLLTSGNDLLDQIDFNNYEPTINSVNNYIYNEIGELKANKQDSITEIKWTISGKIKEVTRVIGCRKYNLKFEYDPMGNRIAKHVFNNNDDKLYSEYYVRDAQGNTLSVYKLAFDESEQLASFAQKELHIYGSSMLGMYKPETELISAIPQGNIYSNYLGQKHFTGSNHLGNTLAVFSDIKHQSDYNTDSIVDSYTADLLAVNDYAPFGGLLSERTFNKGTYPNTFNGKRDDPELGDWQDYGMRMYSPWARRFPTVDPIAKDYPELTTYQFASNTPIWGVDWDGEEVRIYTETTGITGHSFLTVGSGDDIIVYTYGRYLGGSKEKSSSASTDPSGRGVLIRLKGIDAKQYLRHELNDLNAKSFEITDANEDIVKKVANQVFSTGRKLNEQEEAEYKVKYGTPDDARVIDQYNLLKNNCTTKTINATIAVGTELDFIYYTGPVAPDIPNLQHEINIPSDLQGYLLHKSYTKTSNVKNVTDTVKKEVN